MYRFTHYSLKIGTETDKDNILKTIVQSKVDSIKSIEYNCCNIFHVTGLETICCLI